MNERRTSTGFAIRSMMRRTVAAAMSTLLMRDGSAAPYTSLTAIACDYDSAPVILLSDLADHTRNLKADARVSLLFHDTDGYDNPMEGPRVGLLGRAEPVPEDDADRLMRRFVARHPGAARYAEFADFRLYRVCPERAHLIAGFGRARWMEAVDFLVGMDDVTAFARAEEALVARMNEERAEDLARVAERLLGQPPGPWRLIGVDPEGADLHVEGRHVRADFPALDRDPAACRDALEALLARAGAEDTAV
jgi:putative heme iron utilization protein